MNAIFIFTKDRPETLIHTLNALSGYKYRKFLVDDSTEEKHILKNKMLIRDDHRITHITKSFYSAFLQKLNIKESQYRSLLSKPGKKKWNLGYSRNLALLIARFYRFENVLFIDDDIIIESKTIVRNLFANLSRHFFCACIITGLEDHSLLGYIAADLNFEEERLPSGGFLAFKPKKITHYFMNTYNEDWIWVLFNSPTKDFMITGTVTQLYKDQFDGYKTKVIHQEYGEILIEGLLAIVNGHEGCSVNRIRKKVSSKLFWKKILQERADYIGELRAASDNELYNKILDVLSTKYHLYNAADFPGIFAGYFENLKKFGQLIENLSTGR